MTPSAHDAAAPRQRLDTALVARGLAGTRSRAQTLIGEGRVTVDGRPAAKPAQRVAASSRIDVATREGGDYVSRGALKLEGAFDAFDLPSPAGMDCLDIGASTGGFTQVLLRRGARRVIALDVGHGQLSPLIAADGRVTEMSGVNFRDVAAADLPFAPRMAVSDVSFISLTFIIPPLAAIFAANGLPATAVLLVKPQFEVGRGNLGHGGIVRDAGARRQAVEGVRACAEANGFAVRGLAPSPIEGAHGNEEFLLWLDWPATVREAAPRG